MKSYIAPNWHEILTEQGLTNFESLWRLQLKLLDQPNTGRGRNGWSTACHFSLQMPSGIKKRLIIKRQKNHVSRTALHLLRGIPTLEKEARNAFRFKRLGIPVMEVVCYMRRKRADGTEAILVTEHLDGYMPLDKFVKEGIERHRLIEKIKYSLEKLRIGEFGICEECGEEISEERLMARPVAFLCIDCKRAEEKAKRLRA